MTALKRESALHPLLRPLVDAALELDSQRFREPDEPPRQSPGLLLAEPQHDDLALRVAELQDGAARLVIAADGDDAGDFDGRVRGRADMGASLAAALPGFGRVH